ncbi:MAG: DUF502 domain-containing protein [Gemmatimonadota bacterium]|nr:MAG: DUF502 domain-containing protein [Gemmatimonadota bacterium]
MSWRTKKDREALKRLRTHFLTGLVVLTPIVVTAYVFWQLFFKIDGLLSGLLTEWGFFDLIGRRVPGLGFVTLVLLIIFTGMLTRNFVGKKFIELGDNIMIRIPIFNRIYTAVQQISQAFLTEKRSVFRKAVLVEYPRKGIFAIGFLTSDSKGEVQERTETEMCNVFLPTTPNPTSGFLLLVPKTEITPLDMTIEEALKLVISGGTVVPYKNREGQEKMTLTSLDEGPREQHNHKEITADRIQ